MKRTLIALAVVAAAVPIVGSASNPAQAQTVVPPGTQPVVPNPEIADSCGTDVALVLDASGSISSSNAVDDVRNAGEAFLDALADTGSTARVLQFGSISEELAAQEEVTAASLERDGIFGRALAAYYNPKPPPQPGVRIYRYDGSGNPQSSGNWDSRQSDIQYTNWDQSLDQAGERQDKPVELVLYVTDGDPTAYDFNQSGDPFNSSDVGVQTDRDQAKDTTIDRAVQEANQLKAGTLATGSTPAVPPARMLAVGVGSALNTTQSRARLEQIAGPKVLSDGQLEGKSINDVDVALVTDFDDLADFLRSVVNELCTPSLSIRKLAQSPDSSSYDPAPGWDITVTPTVENDGTFTWILPDSDPDVATLCTPLGNPADGAPRTCATDDDPAGLANFQWEPKPETNATSAVVEETLKTGWIAGRPGVDNDWRCTFKNEDGTEEGEEGEFPSDGPPTFTLDVDPQQIITCNIYNSFDYEPRLALTKVDDPTEVRGDLDPAAVVTSTFDVTNPGNTPIANVEVADDKCGATTFSSGDANGNRLLDTTETWTFTCTRSITSPASTDPLGLEIENTAVASGTDPRGTIVESLEAKATIFAFNPAISIEKSVSEFPGGRPGSSIVVTAGSNVQYTYRVLNTGNTPLEPTVPFDDTCTPLGRGDDETGDDDDVLDVGEVWTYSCDKADVTASVTNTVTVDATPLNPESGNPFPDPNPRVTDADTANVDVINPEIELTKTASPTVLLLDEAGTPETVTYTFVAVNTGDAPLARPSSLTEGPEATDPGWVVDTKCDLSPVFFDDDAGSIAGNGDDLIDRGEGWTFTCTGQVGRLTVNLAGIEAQPVDTSGVAVGDPVFDIAFAVVEVLRPGISITKTALRGVVLDPDAVPSVISGPDFEGPLPAEYRYEVVNAGNVPLSLEAPGGSISDDTCDPLTFVGGDTNDDDLLDVSEIWEYSCSQVLDRDDANSPPLPPDSTISGVVENIVTVTGVPFFEDGLVPGKSVTATDDARVQVIEPVLTLTKTASVPIVLAGGDVTYTFVVANEGDVGLDVIGLIDDKCSPLVFVGGDVGINGSPPGNGLLDGANSAKPEEWTYQCTRSVDLPPPGTNTDINVASVQASGPLGNVFEATATAEVRVFDPAIRLVKSARDTLVPAGSEVTYDFEVTNVGQSPEPVDDVLEQIDLIDLRAPGVPACSDPAPSFRLNSNDDEFLDRVGTPDTEEPERWFYSCTATVIGNTTNVAVVGALGGAQFKPPLPVEVFDVSAAYVAVFNPAIEVTKTANPTQVLESGDVTYTYEVRNTGDVPLADVETRITDDKCASVTYVSGDVDEDGLLDTPNSIFEDAADEVWIFTCTARITTDTTNVVTVTGTPTDPEGSFLCGNEPDGLVAALIADCDVTDTATAIVTVQRRGSITIVKDADPNGATPFPFTGTLGSFQLVDDGGTQNLQTFASLAPGTFTVTESAATGWTLESIICVDPTNDSTVSLLTGTATIALGSGENVTCTFRNTAPAIVPPLPPLPPLPPDPPLPPPDPELPATGAAIGVPALLTGLALLVAGLGLTRASRRRRLA